MRTQARPGHLTSLRQVRLARARNELIHGDPDVLTVSAVAVRWGFGHLGRFGAAYHVRYGEPPSRTLRRGNARREILSRMRRKTFRHVQMSEMFRRNFARRKVLPGVRQ